ncbi:LrgB family protein [Chitinivibrio alkaliphilus]|uniref:LrgB-like family protein n=1 Tax=Chitinivibrio alkaliphilus ACht1 TaxID=1313304 RepID=U7D6Y5_9BACT|nr:LrgB family protein [Chitinivibrio alkaliphilus]ERP30827.1 lrgB-like family protein [Chitinivibrio alkaliphilus ACht1]
MSASPIFGVLLTVGCYVLTRRIYLRWKNPLCNPIALSLILIGLVLHTQNIPLDHYMNGAGILVAFLPLTVTILAIPLYRQIKMLQAHRKAIIGGICAGVITSCVSIIGGALLLGLDTEIAESLVPKSITTPLGIEMSRILGAMEAITVLSIVITGVLGVVLYPVAFTLFKIVDPVAKGTALGTASHAVGTSKAIELGETEGAMSSLAIILTGLITLTVTPLILLLLPILLR